MKRIRLGIIGLGVVGSGLVKLINESSSSLKKVTGVDIAISKIAVRDLNKNRSVSVDRSIITTDPFELVESVDVDLVIELMGGVDIPFELAYRSLNLGKPLITANKALLASCAGELFDLAEKKNVPILYEAAVGGVIPVIRSLSVSFAAKRINKIYGILNGTCNYILSEMANEKTDYKLALEKAQKLGFAEADPTFDIEGIDTAHKLAILSFLAYKSKINLKDIHVEGISRITQIDIEMAAEFGSVIKLVGLARRLNGKLDIRVNPAIVSTSEPISGINGALNAISIEGDAIGTNLLVGQGAGAMPTGSAVLGDIVDIARNINKGGFGPLNSIPKFSENLTLLPIEELESCYYLRFQTPDKPGVLACITRHLSENDISVASMIQKGRATTFDSVSVVLTTHKAREKNLVKALKGIEQTTNLLTEKPLFIRLLKEEA